MSKQDAMQEIETIRARLTVLEKIVQEEEKPQGLWRPTASTDKYWYAAGSGDPDWAYCDDDEFDRKHIAFGNCFPTREAAEKAAPLFARAHKFVQAAMLADPDAGLHSKYRTWTLWCDKGEWLASEYLINTEMPAYVHTKEQAEHMAAILNAEGV